MIRRPVAVLLVLALTPASGAEQTLGASDPNVQAAIRKSFPRAFVVTATDVDEKECGPLPRSPGFVSGDFGGSGHPGFAVLLNNGATGKIVDWEGRKLRETRYVFVIFSATAAGEYEPLRVNRFLEFTQVAAFLELQPAGLLTGFGDPGTEPTLKISRPGISFTSCGKSSVVFYISGGKVKEFWTSD